MSAAKARTIFDSKFALIKIPASVKQMALLLMLCSKTLVMTLTTTSWWLLACRNEVETKWWWNSWMLKQILLGTMTQYGIQTTQTLLLVIQRLAARGRSLFDCDTDQIWRTTPEWCSARSWELARQLQFDDSLLDKGQLTLPTMRTWYHYSVCPSGVSFGGKRCIIA